MAALYAVEKDGRITFESSGMREERLAKLESAKQIVACQAYAKSALHIAIESGTFPPVYPLTLRIYEALLEHPEGLRALELRAVFDQGRQDVRRGCENLAFALLTYAKSSGITLSKTIVANTFGRPGRTQCLYKLKFDT